MHSSLNIDESIIGFTINPVSNELLILLSDFSIYDVCISSAKLIQLVDHRSLFQMKRLSILKLNSRPINKDDCILYKINYFSDFLYL